MSFTMRELLFKQVNAAKAKCISSITNLEQLLADIVDEYFNPEEAPTWVASFWSKEVNAVWQELEQIQHYVMVDEDFQRFLNTAEEEVERLVDLFFQWTKRRIVDAKEATSLYRRSRSTIYRWVKQGKLQAKKVKGRWQIFVS